MTTQWFFMLLIAGLMLIGAEVFIPGGVLGVIGGLALIAAASIGFAIFPAGIATVIAIGMILMVGIVIVLWIKLFPHTGIGRQMTAMRDQGRQGYRGQPCRPRRQDRYHPFGPAPRRLHRGRQPPY